MLQTKGDVIDFTRSLAVEIASYNINVNCISPGPIETESWKKIFADMDMNEAVLIVPFKKVAQPE